MDSASVGEVKALPRGAGLLCASSVVNMEWTSPRFDLPITVSGDNRTRLFHYYIIIIMIFARRSLHYRYACRNVPYQVENIITGTPYIRETMRSALNL